MVDGHVRLLTLNLGGSLSWLVVSTNEPSTVKLLLYVLGGGLILLDPLPVVFVGCGLRSLAWLEVRGAVHRKRTARPFLCCIASIVPNFLRLNVLRLDLALLLFHKPSIDHVVCIRLVDSSIPGLPLPDFHIDIGVRKFTDVDSLIIADLLVDGSTLGSFTVRLARQDDIGVSIFVVKLGLDIVGPQPVNLTGLSVNLG